MRLQITPPEVGTPEIRQAAIEWFRRLTNALGLWAVGTRLENVSIANTQTAIPHRLGVKPFGVIVTPRGNATIWQTKIPDDANVYLQASSATHADVVVY